MLLPNGDKRDIHRGDINSRLRREAPEGPETMLRIFGFLFKIRLREIIDRRRAQCSTAKPVPIRI